MEKNKPKVVETLYAILINDEIRNSFSSLSDARKELKNISIGDEVKDVKIVKQTTSQTLIDFYTPKVTRTLTIEELDWN